MLRVNWREAEVMNSFFLFYHPHLKEYYSAVSTFSCALHIWISSPDCSHFTAVRSSDLHTSVIVSSRTIVFYNRQFLQLTNSRNHFYPLCIKPVANSDAQLAVIIKSSIWKDLEINCTSHITEFIFAYLLRLTYCNAT